MDKLKIMLADDHQMFMDGLSALLDQIPAIEIVAAVNNGVQLLEQMRKLQADLVIIDLHMPVLNGLETTKKIVQLYPSVKILGLTMDNDLDSITDMMEAGASGYILKNTGRAELEFAIQQVMRGETYLSQSVGSQLAKSLIFRKKANIEEKSELDILTDREIEILKMIAMENSNMEIAEKLYISPKTVETHRKNLMKKIGAKNSLGVYKFALKYHLINI